MSKLELSVYWSKNPYECEQVNDLIGMRCLYGDDIDELLGKVGTLKSVDLSCDYFLVEDNGIEYYCSYIAVLGYVEDEEEAE